MNRNEFRENVSSTVDEATKRGLSPHTIENILQQEEQNVRENRRVYSVFVYECPSTGCEESATQLIDQMNIRCDICDQLLVLFGSTHGDSVRLKFDCQDHATVRVCEFPPQETTCSIHNQRMDLIESYTTKEGLGK